MGAWQLTGQTVGQVWLGTGPGSGPVEVAVVGVGLQCYEVSVTIINQYQL